MPIAISPKATVDYVLESDRGCDHPTVFKLKPLTGHEYAKFGARMVAENKMSALEQSICLAEACVVGWTDFLDANGKPVPFKRGDLSALDWKHVLELGKECTRINELTEADAKN